MEQITINTNTHLERNAVCLEVFAKTQFNVLWTFYVIAANMAFATKKARLVVKDANICIAEQAYIKQEKHAEKYKIKDMQIVNFEELKKRQIITNYTEVYE